MGKKIMILIVLGALIGGACSYTQETEKTVDSRQKTVDSKPQSEIYNLESKIKDLIKQLGDDDWQTREKTQKELIKIGQVALPYLQEALKSEDPEVRIRTKKIIKEIEASLVSKLPTEVKAEGWTSKVITDGESLPWNQRLSFTHYKGSTHREGNREGFQTTIPVEFTNTSKGEITFMIKTARLYLQDKQESKLLAEIPLGYWEGKYPEVRLIKLKAGEKKTIVIYNDPDIENKCFPFPAKGTKLIAVIILEDNKGNAIKFRTPECKVEEGKK